ncbi:MAG: hypothetical protein LC792_16340 [Actinobacteria bacterium]|nr:hypothetical protein [Actinomycetota bacterium]
MNRRFLWRGVAVVLAVAVGGVACGSDKRDENSEAAPEDLRAPAAQVAKGLGDIDALVKQISATVGADAKAAKEQVEGIEKLWEPIEGTVRANDKDAYIRFEDDFAAMKKAVGDADASKTSSTANDVSEAVKAYVAKYPG